MVITLLGAELQAMRKASGMKSYELANALDINPATLSRYERGHSPIPKLVILAAKYVCEPSLAPQSAEERLIAAIKEVAHA